MFAVEGVRNCPGNRPGTEFIRDHLFSNDGLQLSPLRTPREIELDYNEKFLPRANTLIAWFLIAFSQARCGWADAYD